MTTGIPRPGLAIALLALAWLLEAPIALAGTSGGASSLLVQNGSGAPLTRGDYVSAGTGLDAAYNYFIEVPPGTGSLQIDIFDPNVGGLHDQIVSGGTGTRYQLRNPLGTTLLNFILPFGAGPENVWAALAIIGSPMPGHWELVIDTSSAVTGGTDSQGYGVRAHDGNFGAGGRELNVYVDSFINPGMAAGGTGGGRFHPYVVSGCSAQSNDFDWDGAPTPGFIYTSVDPDPLTAPPARYNSGPLASSTVDGTWLNQALGPWTRDESSEDYGIWTFNFRVAAPAAGDVNGNNTVLYVGEFDSPGPPPGAQPEPDTFRIYLPSDGGTPPVKPQIGQSIIDIVSGVDPPASNQTTVLRLAFTVNNPTPYPITFTAPGHLVDILVPSVTGNRVEYRGNATPTQGTVLAEPSVGGTGTITWNPGTIAPGAWAQLEYDVSIRPQPSSPRTNITGTPASGGSTATYIDETCSGAGCTGVQLARASQTLGPLCELAVNTGVSLATRAVVSELKAYGSRRGTVVEWTTLAEHGTVGFHLLRLDPETGEYARVNDRLLPGLLHSRRGGTYRYVDPAAGVGELHTYRLVELEAGGERREYGPYPVLVAKGPGRSRPRLHASGDAPVANLERAPRPRSAFQKARRKARKAARLKARQERRRRRGPVAKIAVRERGLYYLDASAIGEVMGLRAERIRRLIRRHRLSLTNRGEAVATAPAPGSHGLYFYGEAVGDGARSGNAQDRHDDLYTDENVYLLRRGAGLAMRAADGRRPVPVDGRRFRDTTEAEGNRYTLTHLFDDPDGDYWMWDFRFGGFTFADCETAEPGVPCNVIDFPVPSPGVDAGHDGSATLTVRLHGGTTTADEVDHRVSVSLNGQVIGGTQWDGTVAHSVRFTFPAHLLRESGNSVTVDAEPSTDPNMPSIIYVNDFVLDYPRALTASDDSIHFPGAIARTESVDGFETTSPWVLDLADPARPVRIANATLDGEPGNYRVSFVTADETRPYLAVDPGAARAPAAIVADEPSALRSRHHRADYLIITTGDMMEAARPLADHRAARGLRAMVVDLEDIYDEFNYGIENAEAIWRFLRHAHLSWRRAPRYVVFAGEGSHDYKDFLGNGDAVVPTLLAATPRGLFPSDNLYVDLLGGDGLPEMAAGRLPVMNAEELRAVGEKIIAYENGAEDAWATRAILTADAADDAGNYPADSEQLAATFPHGYDVERLHLDSVDLETARGRLIDALNEGKVFMNFVGHGGSMALGNQGLLRIADLESLVNGDRLPVVTAQTCLAGQFGFPGVDGIGEALLLRPDRGAVAVWAPSGLSVNDQASVLGQGFYQSTFENGERTIGEAILDAQRHYAEQGGPAYLLDVYNLIGDPATIIK